MSKLAGQKVVVKKVSPYPIAVQLGTSTPPVMAQILKLTSVGFMAELGKGVVQVGSELAVQFQIPVLGSQVAVRAKVMKTYDRYNPKGQPNIERMAEFHFLNLDDLQKESIKRFLTAIRQEM